MSKEFVTLIDGNGALGGSVNLTNHQQFNKGFNVA